MKKLRVEDAVGQTLCHDMTAILENGFKGVRFRRGHVIAAEDIPVLLDMGKNHVFVWEPEADEVHEDDAALEVGRALCGENVTLTGPQEGKITVSAACAGLFRLDREGLRAVNRVPDYTAATIRGDIPVQAGTRLCGERIVPLVTKRKNVEAALSAARAHAPVLSVLPFRPLRTGVVITGSEIYTGRIRDGFEPVLTPKLRSYGAEILGFVKCPDELESILAAAESFRDRGAELLLFTGGMSVDPDDLTPTAIRRLGGRFITQGVPMQPGNMLTIAYAEDARGRTALVGVPGASLHAPVTALEVFLPRIFAGVEITAEEISGYGEGGLCMNCPECRFPACPFGQHG